MLTRNRIFPALFPPVNGSRNDARSSGCTNARRGRAESWLDIRWGRVRALRTAIASGRYDVEARIEDLLDDPPAELAGWISDSR